MLRILLEFRTESQGVTIGDNVIFITRPHELFFSSFGLNDEVDFLILHPSSKTSLPEVPVCNTDSGRDREGAPKGKEGGLSHLRFAPFHRLACESLPSLLRKALEGVERDQKCHFHGPAPPPPYDT